MTVEDCGERRGNDVDGSALGCEPIRSVLKLRGITTLRKTRNGAHKKSMSPCANTRPLPSERNNRDYLSRCVCRRRTADGVEG